MISIRQIFNTSFAALLVNKSRSLLTILGIVIGIGSIILIMSITKGASGLILSEVEGIGSKFFEIVPGKNPSGPSDFAQMFTDSLTDKDLNAIRNKINVPFLDKVTPNIMVTSKASYRGEIDSPTIIGTSDFINEIMDIEIDQGRMFNTTEIKTAAAVGVMGVETAKNLFGDEDPINKKIKIRDKNIRIIGLYPEKGKVAFADIDNIVFLPYTTVKKFIETQNHYNSLTGIVKDEKRLEQTISDLEKTLRETNKIQDPEDDDFHIVTQKDVIDRVSNISSVLNILLVSVAAISLLVGGIGIMNVMLVSVTERTREIGLRKALGATENDIKRQFLIEAVTLTLIGGMIGIIGGVTLSITIIALINKFQNLDIVFSMPYQAIFLSLAVSSIVGLVFGLYPAISAAKKNPIEALRHE